jgi:hypothetical protein
MKLKATIFHLIACANVSLAFSPILHQGSRLTTLRSSSRTRVFSSQWDEDDDGAGVDQATSFEDAGEGLQNEDDNKRMDDMGDYDANPAVSFVSLIEWNVLQFDNFKISHITSRNVNQQPSRTLTVTNLI